MVLLLLAFVLHGGTAGHSGSSKSEATRPAARSARLGDGFWHTRGSQILDAADHPVRIAGINWYGFETLQVIPGGLDQQDYDVILQSIQRSGYNTVRLPFSNQMIEAPSVPPSIRFTNRTGPINTALKGLNSLEILDKIIAAAGTHGLKVILDNHRSEAGDGPELSGLWFTQGYPESAWIADWQMLARRYAGNPTVLGFDLRNEPHNASKGGACWGCGGINDWRFAAERAGNAVLSVNPHLLIFVEGVDACENDFYWWGGNLMGVKTAPVRLAIPNQLVYSAHDYGPAESTQPWFTPEMSETSLNAVWTKHWAFIAQQNLAPVWLGEFGVETPDTSPAANANAVPVSAAAEALEARWFQSLVHLLTVDPRLGWTYWTLNATDRYGLMNPGYLSYRSTLRQAALATIQFPFGPRAGSIHSPGAEAGMPAPAPRPVIVPGGAANISAGPAATAIQCHVTYTNLNDWKVGFSTSLLIHNAGTTPIEGWKLTWNFAGNQKIDQLWNAHSTQNGSAITVTNEVWNATIAPGADAGGIGFNGSYSGSNPPPTSFYLNGTACR